VEAALDDVVSGDPELERELKLGRSRGRQAERQRQAAAMAQKIGADSSKRITEAERKKTLSVNAFNSSKSLFLRSLSEM
jgi:hypothetical protein